MSNFRRGKKRKRSGKHFGLQFAGADELMYKIDEISHFGVLVATKKALKATHALVTPKLEAEIKKHRRTGQTEDSLVKQPQMKVEGTYVSVAVGFDLDNGGLPSIWLMHGSPRQQPDNNLYRALYGRKTAGQIRHVQYHAVKETLEEYLNKK